ncbi:hypothetical protein FRC12_015205 [Ceratobasidium sp. 428]|nr:hypothetical protein FRC12_015205 [Ceratobasidium sp. 428]
MTEQQESTTLVELPIQALCQDPDPAQPRLNEIQEDDERSKVMVHASIVSSPLLQVTASLIDHARKKHARDQTFGEGLRKPEYTKIPDDLRPVYMMIDRTIRAAEPVPDSHPDKPDYLNFLGDAYNTLFGRLGELQHIHMAIDCQEQAVALTPDGHPNKPGRLNNLGNAYQRLFDRLGELQHIHLAVDFQAQAVALTPDGHPDKPAYLSNLGSAYKRLFDRLGELQHIHMAVDCMAQSVALTPDGHPNKPAGLSNLGNVYETLFNRLGELQHIHVAIDCMAQSVALTPDGHPNKPACLSNLGNVYETLFNRLGELQHVHMTIDCQEQAVALTPDSHPDKPGRLNNLGNAYQRLFDRLGELQHIHLVVDYKAQAVALTSDGHPNKAAWLNNLGNTYETLFNRLGELQHIHVAIDCKMQAVALTPDGHPDKPGCLNNLGNAYQTLFDRLGELQHIHMAIDCKAQAVALTPDGHPYKPGRLNNLGNAYDRLFDRLGEMQHIHMATNYKAQAVALTPNDHPHKPDCLNNLGGAYTALFKQQGELEHALMATSCFTQAVTLTPDSHPAKPSYLDNLGLAYQLLFNRTGELQHIHLAIDCHAQAVALTSEGDPSGAQRLTCLGCSYRLLFTTSHKPEYVAKSKLYSQCAALSPTGIPMDRLIGAIFWARLSKPDGSDALEAYSQCMLRLPEAVWLGTSVRRRFECLTPDIQGVISEAAAVAILASRYDLAVEWLEQGRCLVWSQILQLRTPLDEIHVSHPELANELRRLSSRLENTGSFAQDYMASNTHEGLSQNDSYMRSHLANERDKLIDEIRLKPGFDDFLRPSKASTIISHVQHGATVILAVHELRCDAIIIESDAHDIAHVPLPDFSRQKAEVLRQELVLCLKSQGIARGVKKGDRPLQASFENVLATLWSNVVKPVLDHLNINQVLLVDNLPHITWCITGSLSFLPVHAAGIYNSPSTILSNLAISSYTPTISSMGRSSLTPPIFSGMLAVGHQSSIRGLSSLPGTKDELDQVEEQFMNKRFTRLDEDAATVDAVVKAMADHSWVHFACHGSQDLVDPMNSALHLHDKPLTLAMISRHSMKNAQLAFLSACQTATGDSEFPDEAVHLAAGLLMAGYANVIATLWSIGDRDAPIVAGEVYKCLLEGGVPDSRKAAKALHRAVKHLQDTIGVKEFARWVPYIHMGG